MEKTNIPITDIAPYWGRVADQYENDPTLWTTRNSVFYLPATSADSWGVAAPGQPETTPAAAWTSMLNDDIDMSANQCCAGH
jgi:hypothetical protein